MNITAVRPDGFWNCQIIWMPGHLIRSIGFNWFNSRAKLPRSVTACSLALIQLHFSNSFACCAERWIKLNFSSFESINLLLFKFAHSSSIKNWSTGRQSCRPIATESCSSMPGAFQLESCYSMEMLLLDLSCWARGSCAGQAFETSNSRLNVSIEKVSN